MSPDEFRRRARDRVMPIVLTIIVLLALAVGVFGFAAFQASNDADRLTQQQAAIERLIASQARESAERRHENCVISEREQKTEVDQLARTYEYLADLSPAELRQSLNRAVLAQLPQVELEAAADNAPPYCDEPGVRAERDGAKPVGLPEPDPCIPARPVSLGPGGPPDHGRRCP